MRSLVIVALLMTAQVGLAKVNCSSDGESVVIDSHRKVVEIVRDGQSRQLKIVSQNPHAYRLFGESTYQLENGYVLGLKATKSKSKKNLTVFRSGEPVASVSDCSVN